MRPVDRITSSPPSGRDRYPAAGTAAGADEPVLTPQRALVPLTVGEKPARPVSHPAGERSRAPFVAHLIATDRGAPQTRPRRRVSPDEAVAAYRAALAAPQSERRLAIARVA